MECEKALCAIFYFALKKIESMLLALCFLPAGDGTARTEAGTLNPEIDYLSLDFCKKRNEHLLCLTHYILGTVCYRSLGGCLSNKMSILIKAKVLEGDITSKRKNWTLDPVL